MTTSDYVNAKWQRVAVVNNGALTVPAGRALHAAAYDADLNHLVVYGGDTKNIHALGEIVAAPEVWELDLNVNPPAWRNVGTPLGDRIGASMIYDPVHKAPLLYGGRGKLRAERQTVSGDLYALVAREVVFTPTPTAVPTVSPYGPLEPRLCPTLNGRSAAGGDPERAGQPERLRLLRAAERAEPPAGSVESAADLPRADEHQRAVQPALQPGHLQGRLPVMPAAERAVRARMPAAPTRERKT
ncbi:MAG: hypothetical protein U0470_12830 [Anaerolineae bacterium]